MNKRFLLVFVLFLPVIAAGIWFLSVSQGNLTSSGVSAVILELPDGSQTEYVSDDDKQFFVDFKDSIVSIEKQEYDPAVHSLYKLKFVRVQGDVQYYLCLSADIKNCLAFDSSGSWYRIDKDYAKRFLALQDTSSVYRNSDVPVLNFVSNGITTTVSATEAQWYYLLSDESYSEVIVENVGSLDDGLYVMSGNFFDFSFNVVPDWYDVKVYDGDTLLYDGLSGNFYEFSHHKESKLRAIVTAEWYADTTSLYHGRAVYDIFFDYDIKATYSIDKKETFPGEAVYVSLLNVDNELLEITSTLTSLGELSAHNYADGKIIIVPIHMETAEGEYRINIRSDRTSLSIPITVKEKVFETQKIGFVGSESAESYNSAHTLFEEEISSAFGIVLSEANWINGLLTPVKKYVEGGEQYWVSWPSYGVFQNVNGSVIDERSKGIHYVKAVTADSLPMRSVANGAVAFAGLTTLYGNTVVIEHGMGFKTVYGHLDTLNVTVGEIVSAGTVVGNAKPSAYAVSSTECFFGICVDGIFLNPYNFIIEPRTSDGADISGSVDFLVDLQTGSEQ